MTRHHLLPVAFAGFIGALAGGSAALTQPTVNPAIVKPAEPKPAEPKPAEPKPSETKPSDLPAMVFFVAKGEANACGPGCNEWIAADGKIDLAADQRLRKLLAKLGRRKLPIFLHSGGGAVLGSIELGRLIRSQKIQVSVARTIPSGCDRDKLRDKSCEVLKRSGQDLASELDPNGAMCNSGCVLALSGGAVRSVPPWMKLGVHAIGVDLEKTSVRGAALAAATRAANARIVDFLRDMGISKALFDTSNAVPHESSRFLQRDELVRFGIDTREFGETRWWYAEKPIVAIAKSFFVRTGKQEPAYPNALLRLSCGIGKSIQLTFARERVPNAPLGAGLGPLRLSVNGLRMDLPYGTSAAIETRTIPLLANVVDSADDNGAIEVFGFDPGRNNEPQSPITLDMKGFSAAYAKLRKACDDSSRANDGCSVGDFSPRCTPEALRTWPPKPTTAGGPLTWPSR
jgi:hypothetical protein